MGLDQSKPLEQWDSIMVAEQVRKLGHQYELYASTVLDNCVDGLFLAGLTFTERQETMDDLKIHSRLHRRVLDKKLSNLIGLSSVTSSSKEDHFASGASADMRSSMADFSSSMLSPSSVVTTRSFQRQGTDGTVDYCRRRNRRRSTRFSSIVLDEDKSEVLSTSIASAMDEEKSETEALLRRQKSLEVQIQNLVSIAARGQ
jgi:hypothetical protein